MTVAKGMKRGQVYPAASARHLLNPLRNLVQPASRVVRALSLTGNEMVLELGCGPGWFSPRLARSLTRGRLVMCDVQHDMARIAGSRTMGLPHAHPVVADALRLPYRASSFDVVLLATMLGETADAAGCLGEVRRVLRGSGRLVVAETRRDSDFLPLHDVRDMAESVGFGFSHSRGPRWEYIATFVSTGPR